MLGHWGEMLLFWLDRADSLSRIAGLQRSVSDYMRSNFFITTSGMLNPALLHHALSVTSVDRLIFSTDYPFQHPTREDIDSFLGHFSSDDERQQFSSAQRGRSVRSRFLKCPRRHPRAAWRMQHNSSFSTTWPGSKQVGSSASASSARRPVGPERGADRLRTVLEVTAVFVHGNPETAAVWSPLLAELGRSRRPDSVPTGVRRAGTRRLRRDCR